MIKQIFDVIKNHSMNSIHVIHNEGHLCTPVGSVQLNKQTQYFLNLKVSTWNNCILIISYHHWLDYHASQIWLLEVLCSARHTGGFLPFSPPSYIALNMSWYFIVFKRMRVSFNHDVNMTGFYTNISSSFMPYSCNKKGPYFVTESLFH